MIFFIKFDCIPKSQKIMFFINIKCTLHLKVILTNSAFFSKKKKDDDFEFYPLSIYLYKVKS